MDSTFTHGKIVPLAIEDEMEKSYIDYAMSVIVGRALPDVRDGLKPVHRRILYSMYERGVTPDKPHKKSARIVGDVLGKYHPHGDSSVYDAVVRLAQDFSIRYLLIDGHGNFGSVDGDSAAAMRYTEVRLSKYAVEMMTDIQKDTVDFIPNYDASEEEPAVLPARVPNLLVNGSSGIAVGMATNIPPHNIGEVIDGVVGLIDDPDIEISQLMTMIKGPDFPTGALIMGREGIKSAYTTGRGSIKMRAKVDIEQMSNGKQRIIVNEIPYQVNKARLIEKIADLVKDKRIDGITDLRDESDRTGMRIVIELRKDVNGRVILNQLYKHTQLQENFGVITLALVDGQPKILNLKQVLIHYLEHQKDVIVRRTRFELAKAEARAHILEGLKIALDHIEEVIKTIRESKTTDVAREQLMTKFSLSEKQAQAILEMRLRALTGLEREKLDDEYRELIKTISYLTEVLRNEKMVLHIIREEILVMKEKYADPRRTQIVRDDSELDEEDLIAEEDMVITITNNGYIKRLNTNVYRNQKRGGRGITAMTTKEEDFVEHLFITTTHHYLMVFTNKGKVYRLKVHEIPEAGRTAKGTALVNLLYLSGEETVNTVIPVKEYSEDLFLFMATRQGIVKKSVLKEYDSARKDGLIAIHLDENDELIGVKLTDGTEEIILGTRNGKAILFSEEEVRSQGRTTRGVKGIQLGKNDWVVSMDAVTEGGELMVISENGFGKRTPLNEYSKQSRGGKGALTIKETAKTGPLTAIKVVKPGDELMMITKEGTLIRINVSDTSVLGRNTQGVTLMKLNSDDKVVAVAKVVSKDDEV
ncbi:DNA gyrase subunit A [Dehalobacterium formicoaceticum]|uniref:DNA gyrase subunit A n=1 Tax=Dehalobacterium formicoaceticum TaxID=51515 RepID=UPI000B801E41|nr:DNA gyrase subunit A [Dehalobacterium formicoaceticum]